MYEVHLVRSAADDIKGLPAAQRERIVGRIVALGGDPRPPRSRKMVGSDQAWRVRVGQYRVVYEVDDAAREVRIMRVRHRRSVYR
jgi:mRNA interferase RelE/StbE